ncbi:MAG: AI-2E family transporter [Lewinellaceae bacterium]|nr:AI-2E family transporter [Phaeodactylibacter sp.]MCB9036283.1 AI-2E family transporter [Lewinellaceae bacterium]
MPTRPYIRPIAFWLMLIGITASFIGMIGPFLLALFWAALLALTFYRPYRILRWRLRGRENLAAALSSLLIILIVVVPGFFILLALVNESVSVYQKIQSGEWDLARVVDFIETQSPRLEEALSMVGLSPDKLRENVSNFAVKATGLVADRVFNYTQNALSFTAQFFLMLYVLFFFLRDGRKMLNAAINVVPLGNKWERTLIERFASVARATLKGTLIVAVVQGSIGGLMFAILGIEGALFWGVMMTILSLLPVGGSAIVWAPAAAILAWQGLWGKAIALVIVGTLGIGLIDNILRPILVGRDTKMPDFLVLLATLGGIAWFGLSGFVLGPVIAALFLTFWQTAGKEYGGADE